MIALRTRTLLASLSCLLLLDLVPSTPALAALPDEVQVYDDSINKPGEFGLELHVNATPAGRGQPDYPGEITPVHGLRTTFEPSFGWSEHLEVGAYLPFDHLANGEERFAGPRARLKWIFHPSSSADPRFFGVNFELSHVKTAFEQSENFLEVRPLLGWHTATWLLAFNPAIGVPLKPGQRTGGPEFSPALKLARKVGDGLAAGFEYYAALGKISHPDAYSDQGHTLYLALDVDQGPLVFNFGVGRGLTGATDHWTVKAIFELPI
jgi:hypothetical protein